MLEHVEEPYRETATIRLDNHDRALDPANTGADFRGCAFTIGYGYVAPSGNMYLGDGTNPAMPNLWVKSQHITSVEGKVVCDLVCEGMWGKLRDVKYLPVATTGDSDLSIARMNAYLEPQEFGGTQTIKTLIELILAGAGMTLNATYTSDGIIDVIKPFISYNPNHFQGAAGFIENGNGYGLLQMTKSYMRPEAANVFKLIYPQSTDAIDETYWSGLFYPLFKEYTEKRNLTIPNDIVVYWGYEKDPVVHSPIWTDEEIIANLGVYGEAIDTDSTGAYATVYELFYYPHINTHAEADLIAAGILARYKSETLAGRLVLPFHDCRVELYDRVIVYDSRGT
jgi:hypothetical protein